MNTQLRERHRHALDMPETHTHARPAELNHITDFTHIDAVRHVVGLDLLGAAALDPRRGMLDKRIAENPPHQPRIGQLIDDKSRRRTNIGLGLKAKTKQLRQRAYPSHHIRVQRLAAHAGAGPALHTLIKVDRRPVHRRVHIDRSHRADGNTITASNTFRGINLHTALPFSRTSLAFGRLRAETTNSDPVTRGQSARGDRAVEPGGFTSRPRDPTASQTRNATKVRFDKAVCIIRRAATNQAPRSRRHKTQHPLGHAQAPQCAAATPLTVPSQPKAFPDMPPNPAFQFEDLTPVLGQSVVPPPADHVPPPLVQQLPTRRSAAAAPNLPYLPLESRDTFPRYFPLLASVDAKRGLRPTTSALRFPTVTSISSGRIVSSCENQPMLGTLARHSCVPRRHSWQHNVDGSPRLRRGPREKL